jgi:hypothetical protein
VSPAKSRAADTVATSAARSSLGDFCDSKENRLLRLNCVNGEDCPLFFSVRRSLAEHAGRRRPARSVHHRSDLRERAERPPVKLPAPTTDLHPFCGPPPELGQKSEANRRFSRTNQAKFLPIASSFGLNLPGFFQMSRAFIQLSQLQKSVTQLAVRLCI